MRRFKCLSFVALFVLSLTASSIVFSDNANAASIYDDVLTTTNELIITDYSNPGIPNGQDTYWETRWYPETLEALRLRCNATAAFCQAYNVFQNLVSSGSNSSWYVLQIVDENQNDRKTIRVIFTDNSNSGNCSFNTTGGTPRMTCAPDPGGTLYYSIELQNNGFCNSGNIRTENCNFIGDSQPITAPSFNIVQQNLLNNASTAVSFLSTFDITYPSGYEGAIVPETYTPPSQLSEIEFQYEIDSDGTTRLKYLGNYEFPLNCDGRYTAQKYFNSNWDGEDYENTFEVVDGPMETFTATGELTGAGYYVFIVQPDDESACNPPPDTFMAAGVIRVYWDGFNAIQGNNVGGCDIDFCSNLSSQQSKINKLMNSLTVDMFGLQQAIFAPVQFLSSAATAPCTTLVLPIPKMGNMDIPCMTPIYNQYQPQLISIWQSIITGLVSYYVVINIIARIKKTSDPKDDSIEVAQL